MNDSAPELASAWSRVNNAIGPLGAPSHPASWAAAHLATERAAGPGEAPDGAKIDDATYSGSLTAGLIAPPATGLRTGSGTGLPGRDGSGRSFST
ncbi:hypothetical protein [Kitasatospora sp. NPDC004272]